MTGPGEMPADGPDAGAPDAGSPDAGSPDAATPDAATPDAETPDAETSGGGTPETSGAETPEAVPLLEPRDGMPPLVATPAELAAATAALAGGSGPVALDAERASGFRYGHRAFLVQFRRAGSGTVLIDPVGCPDFAGLDAALAGAEVVLHAASQDLPCLAELGYRPRLLFDTELAGRLLGYPRVGLGTLVETVLGLRLEKSHSAADWSTRPLPEEWLKYAALDVEVLVELRDMLAAQLADAGKDEWARQEFAAVLAAGPPPPRKDPWRRTSGIHRVRQRRGLAAVREMWNERDDIARRRDMSPTRLLPDAAIIAAARAMPGSAAELAALNGFNGRGARRHAAEWVAAISRAKAMPDRELPDASAPAGDGPPPAHRWAERDPAAARRLAAARAAVTSVAETVTMPSENVLAPDALRRLAWLPPQPLTGEAVSAQLAGCGARPWQVQLTAVPLTAALTAAAEAEPPPS